MICLSRFKNHLFALLNEAVDDVQIFRKPRTGEVLADCHRRGAAEVLTACGFEQQGGDWSRFRQPQGLSEAEQKIHATRAMVRLFKARYYANLDRRLWCPDTEDATWAEPDKSHTSEIASTPTA